MKSELIKKGPKDITFGGFTLTPVGVSIEGSPDIEEWQAAMRFVEHAQGGVMWWLGDLLVHGEASYGELASQEDGDGKFERKTLWNARYVAEKVKTSLRKEGLSWNHHNLVAGMAPSQQKKWLDKAEKEDWSVATLRKETADHRARKTLAETPLPRGRYHVILADPPWRYEFSQSDSRKIENQYPTMEVEDICSMADGDGRTVANISAPDCVIFLWTTSPKLEEGLLVMKSWGFEYKTCMVWRKDKIGPGYYARQQHEILLIGTQGMPPQCNPSSRPPSVIDAERTEHSKKPVVFYEIIEKMYPNAKKVELFCRSPRNGWDAWGNEI